MPTFAIYTNVPKGNVPDGFLLKASAFLAGQLGKPEKFINVRVHPDQMMSHAGTTDPCGCVEIGSIGALGERNKEHAKAVGEFISENLKIPTDRFYVTFVDIEAGNIALNLETFEQIFAKR